MRIELSCAMCGAEKTVEADTKGARTMTVWQFVENAAVAAGWIVQRNGDYLDLYCSKKCAK